MANWRSHADSQERQIITQGTVHRAFSSTAVTVVLNSIETEVRIPPAMRGQVNNFVASAISQIDDRLFNQRIQTYEQFISDHLNSIINRAVSHVRRQ